MPIFFRWLRKASLSPGSVTRRRHLGNLNYQCLEQRQLLAPMAGDDFFAAVGNTRLEVSASGAFGDVPSLKITASLFDNDDAGLTLDAHDSLSAQGAQIGFEPDGSFVYDPVVLSPGVDDTFEYTVTDGFETATATVYIRFLTRVWYVDSGAASGGDGTSIRPFDSLAPLNANGSDVDETGETIFVFANDLDLLANQFQLEDEQRLIGRGVDLESDGNLLLPAGNIRPRISSDNVTIRLASNNEIAGIELQSRSDSAISGGNGSVFVHDCRLQGDQRAIDLGSSFSDVTVDNCRFDHSGFYLNSRQLSSVEIVNNVFSVVETSGVEIVGRGSGTLFATLDISHNLFDRVFQPIDVDADLFRTSLPTGDARVANNQITGFIQPTPGSYSIGRPAISISGGFNFENGSLADNIVERRRVVFEMLGPNFINYEFGDMRLTGGMDFSIATGNLTFDKLEVVNEFLNDATQVNLKFFGNRPGEFNVSIGELVYSSGSSVMGAPSKFDVVNLNQFTVGTGSLELRGATVRIAQSTIDVNLDTITSDNPNQRFTTLELTNVEGNFVVNGAVNLSKTNDVAGGYEEPTQIRLRNANADFYGPVTINTLSGVGLGIQVSPAEGNQVVFHDEVTVKTRLRNGIEIGPGETLFLADVDIDTVGTHSENGILVAPGANVRFEGQLRINTDLPTALAAIGLDTEVYINDLVIRAHGGGAVQFQDLGSGTIKTGRIFVDDVGINNGRAFGAWNSNLDVKLHSVWAEAGLVPAITLSDTTGQFRVVGDGVDTGLGGNGSGGFIVDRVGAGAKFLNAENVKLLNINFARNKGDTIRLANVHNIRLANLFIAQNYDKPYLSGISATNVTGDFVVDKAIINVSSGLAGVRLRYFQDSVLDSLRIADSRITGVETSGNKYGVVVSASGMAQINQVVFVRNEFLRPAVDQIFVRTSDLATLNLEIRDNSLRRFKRGIVIVQRGQSELEFGITRNTIIGQADGTSSHGIFALGLAGTEGSGLIDGYVANQSEDRGIISHCAGVRFQMDGTSEFGSTGRFTMRDNRVAAYSGFSGIIAVAGIGPSVMDFIAERNVLVNPTTQNVMGISVVAGITNDSSSGIANATIRDNRAPAGAANIPATQNAAYFLVQLENKVLNLTAPAGNPAIGQTFINTDGGVLLSTGASGNNNQVDEERDVIVVGAVNIIARN